MKVRSVRVGFLSTAILACTSCSAERLERGVRHYENADLPAARAELERVLVEAPCLSRSDWARYALYRGLTELALGNGHTAHAWLLRARLALAKRPQLLEAGERARLAAAWRSLGLLPAQR